MLIIILLSPSQLKSFTVLIVDAVLRLGPLRLAVNSPGCPIWQPQQEVIRVNPSIMNAFSSCSASLSKSRREILSSRPGGDEFPESMIDKRSLLRLAAFLGIAAVGHFSRLGAA